MGNRCFCVAKIAVVERYLAWDTTKEELVKSLGFYQTTKGERVFEAGFKISCPNSILSVICNGRRINCGWIKYRFCYSISNGYRSFSCAFPLHPISAGTLKKSHSLRAASTYENSNKIVSFIASRAPNNQKLKLLLFGMNCQCCGLPVHSNTVISSLSGSCTSPLFRNFARDKTFYVEIRKHICLHALCWIFSPVY
jgi:hypothetical protein